MGGITLRNSDLFRYFFLDHRFLINWVLLISINQ